MSVNSGAEITELTANQNWSFAYKNGSVLTQVQNAAFVLNRNGTVCLSELNTHL